MPAAKETIGQIEYYSRAMKAPRIREAATRLADQAREGGWTHEDYLAAVLSREVAAREASGAEIRARAAGFPARKSLEDFNFDHQPGLKRDTIAHLATGAFLTEASNIVLLGPPGTGSCSPPPSTGSPASKTPIRTAGCPRNWSGCAATG
jgi:DNA replication protein DnaC